MTKRRRAKPREVVGGLLRALREESDLTQRQLGARLGRPQSWVFLCEQGQRRVEVEEFIAWATACAVDPMIAFDRAIKSLP